MAPLALALMACSWPWGVSPGAWLAQHTPSSLKQEGQAVFHAATSTQASTPSPTARPTASPLLDTQVVNPELPPVSGAPAAFELLTSGNVDVAEPGAGIDANFIGPVPVSASGASAAVDDTASSYVDPLYATLCGPGAVAIALYYWPSAGDQGMYANVMDPMMGKKAVSSWGDLDIDGVYRMRGYIMRLAYQTQVPGWRKAGMLPQSTFQSGEVGGATLQVVRDTLNWEASGENKQEWANYFYTVQWNSAYRHSTNYPQNLFAALHNDIVTDLALRHAPVIVEVTAGYLPNWHDANPVYHFIAITGYDDTAGTYTYLDTCKAYTGCNTAGGLDAPGRHMIDQLQLSAAVTSVSTNQKTGDGGWVW
jgi:hypothetical protein